MMAEKIAKKPAPRGSYIPAALEKHCLNGDAYIMVDEVYDICTGGHRSYQMFQGDLAEQIKLGKVHREGRRLYLTKTWRYEDFAAAQIANILESNSTVCPKLSENLADASGITLNEEQCEAVRMALSHRLSIVLGGAGTGKSTLVRKIIEDYPMGRYVLAAPTGKAARNLTLYTGEPARTVHSALGLRPDDDALSPVIWEYISLVVVDEASMLTLELLAGLLCKARKDCRIILVGDPEQLLSVGSGNVLPDLLELGVPCVRLNQNFRQADQETALYYNVVKFSDLRDEAQLRYDDSFRLEMMDEQLAEKTLIDEAVRRYRTGESIQVLSPYNIKTKLSIQKLNRSLQEHLNPASGEKKELEVDGVTYRDGDRVIITKNDYDKGCVNGDIGVLWIDSDDVESPAYRVELESGRCPQWYGWYGLAFISHAYALTVHKSQGSQYDTILFPVVEGFSGMLYRNLLYTAISRAKKRVFLYGSKSSVDAAIRTPAKPRRSMLVSKTKMVLLKKVG